MSFERRLSRLSGWFFRPDHFSRKPTRLCENSRFVRKRARSERIFAIGRLLIAQNGPNFRENWIDQFGLRVFTQSATFLRIGGFTGRRLFPRTASAANDQGPRPAMTRRRGGPARRNRRVAEAEAAGRPIALARKCSQSLPTPA
jgi:hypothetical protein